MRKLMLFSAAAALLCAQEFPATVSAIPLATGFGSLTQITSSRDGSGRLFVVELAGRIWVLQNGTIQPSPLLDIRDRVRAAGEQGLLGLAFPPGYGTKGYYYVNFTREADAATVVSRISNDGSEQRLFIQDQPYGNHNGGMIAFSPRDGQMYVGMGDGGSAGDPQNRAQDPNTRLGKMLRLDAENGAVQPEIWASGLRNPWRFSFDRTTSDLWIADVGQDRLEEIDFQSASSTGGENYGWRLMEGSECYQSSCSTAGLTLPVFEYGRDLGCSVIGGYVYRGRRAPAANGLYFFSDLCSGNLWATRQNGSGFETRLIKNEFLPGITSFGEDENGELYAVTGGGSVYQLMLQAPAVSAAGVVNAASYARGLTPGSIASIFAPGISTVNGIMQAGTLPLPRELNRVSVTIGGVDAPVFAVANVLGQEQINVQVPWELAGRSAAPLVVTVGGVATAPAEVELNPVNPGIFAVVRGASTTTIYATGLGAVADPPATGAVSGDQRTASLPRVTIGGATANVTYSGLAPGYVGLYQINVDNPTNVAAGSSVIVEMGGTASNPVAW